MGATWLDLRDYGAADRSVINRLRNANRRSRSRLQH
jgi:hypothetical protein